MSKQKSEDTLEYRVIKKDTCKTLSGKSTLTYHVGLSPDSEIHFRIQDNSGGGFFSQEWVSLKDIRSALEKNPKGNSITSYVLQPLFKGKSVNTPAFLLSALIKEKLLIPLPGKKRYHQVLDPSDFMGRMEKLISSGAEVKTKTSRKPTGTTGKTTAKAPPASKKKAAIKKKSMSRKKTA